MNREIERVMQDVLTSVGSDFDPKKTDWHSALNWTQKHLSESIAHIDGAHYFHRDTLITAAAALIGMVARYAPYPVVNKGMMVVVSGENGIKFLAKVIGQTDTPEEKIPSNGSKDYRLELMDGTQGVWNSDSIVGIVQ